MPTSKKPILVIGDACKDVFVYCHCERLCPEAPVPVLDIRYQEDNLGMAGNVYRNILALDYPCDLIANPGYDTITKTRYVDVKTNHMFLRIDNNPVATKFNGIKIMDFDKYSAIVISDYDKGFITERDIEYIGMSHPLTFLDTKKILGTWARNMTFIKVNHKEYCLSQSSIDQVLEPKIIETLGEEGCRFRQVRYPVNTVEIKNLSGAGDTFLAGLVVKYIESNGDIGASLIYANQLATIVVQKRGVSTVKD